MEKLDIPIIIKNNIEEISVEYINFNGEVNQGVIVCNKKLSNDLKSIFTELLNMKFPIFQVRPVSDFNNSDIESVKNNNCSCFNFRMVIGSNKLSDHSTGSAIDINPMQNPWVHPIAHKIEGTVRKYDLSEKGTVNDQVVNIFKKYGWSWGGTWKNPDYQHFFKPDNELKNKVLNKSFIQKFHEFSKKVINKLT